MKKLARIFLGIVGGFVALLAVGLVTGLEGVDDRPYFTAPYYTNTVARLRAATNRTLVVHGPLAAGFGRARLTPTLNVTPEDPAQGRFRSLPLAGYGARQGRPATGTHDDLWVKAIAVRVQDRTAVLISADALIIPWDIADEAASQLGRDPGLGREQLYFGATHTHASLGGWGEGMVAEAFAGPHHPGVRIWFAGQLVAAARAALADLKPASFGRMRVKQPLYVRNRLVGTLGAVDDELGAAVFRQDGGTVAVLGTYAAHATVLSSRLMEFSGDYPGYWQREVERETGGLAVFFAGGLGSHSPNAGGGGFEGAERMGRALAQAVTQRLPGLSLTNQVDFGLLGCAVDLPPLHARVTDGWRLRPFVAKRLLPVRASTYLQALRLGDAVWAATPCDFSGELALEVKDFFRSRGQDAVVTSFNGDYIGYVIPARYYHLGGYEPRTMSFFGPTVPDYFGELIRSMGTALAR